MQFSRTLKILLHDLHISGENGRLLQAKHFQHPSEKKIRITEIMR